MSSLARWGCAAVLLGGGCGGCDGPRVDPADATMADADDVRPEVVATTPTADQTGVEPLSAITVEFSEDMDPATLEDALRVVVDGAEVSGSIAYDETDVTMTFTPHYALDLTSTFEATVTTVAADRAGNTLAEEYVWSFTVRDGVWSAPERVDTDFAGGGSMPSVALDGRGGVTVAYLQSDGTNTSPWANHLDGETWAGAALLESDYGFVWGARVATDREGRRFVAWAQDIDPEADYDIWVRPAVGDGAWGAPVRLATDVSGGADVVFIAPGVALALWRDDTGVRTLRYVEGSGWDADAATIGHPLGWIDVRGDRNGGAMAVWVPAFEDGSDVMAQRYAGDTWSDPVPVAINESIEESQTAVRVAVDGDGNAIAVWERVLETRVAVWWNRYTVDGGWGEAAPLDTDDSGSASDPQIAINARGEAMAVWRWSDGVETPRIVARRFTDGAWDDPETVADGLQDRGWARVAVDGAGRTMLVWLESTRFCATARRHVPGVGWSAPTPLEVPDVTGTELELVGDPSGMFVAAWRRIALAGAGIYVARFH